MVIVLFLQNLNESVKEDLKKMSVTELKERHIAATETVNNLRERLKQRRLSLLDTDSEF